MPKQDTLIQLLLYQIICYKCVSKSYLLNNFLFFFVNFNESLYFTPFINQNNFVRMKPLSGKNKNRPYHRFCNTTDRVNLFCQYKVPCS